MRLSEVMAARASARWVKPDPEAGTAFRIHLKDFPDRVEGLQFFLEGIGEQLGLENLPLRVSATGPSLKCDGARVIAFSTGPGEAARFEKRFNDINEFLALNRVVCVEAGDAQFHPNERIHAPRASALQFSTPRPHSPS